MFSRGELVLLMEALDSHEYWQLSDPVYRNSGYVREPGSDDPEKVSEIRETRALLKKIEGMVRAHEGATDA